MPLRPREPLPNLAIVINCAGAAEGFDSDSIKVASRFLPEIVLLAPFDTAASLEQLEACYYIEKNCGGSRTVMRIYKVTNEINGKVYIGQTTQSLSKRRKGHERIADDFAKGKVTYFIWALREFGMDSFTWEVLCECRSPEELNTKEKMYIEQFSSNNPDFGYN